MADNTIALQLQQPQFNTPFQLQQGALTIQQLMQRSQQNQMDLQKQKLDMQDQMTLAKLWSNPENVDRKVGLLDPKKINPETLQNPQIYGQIVQKYNAAQYAQSKESLELSKAQRDQQKEQHEVAVGVMEDAHSQYADDIKNGIPVNEAEQHFQQALLDGVNDKKKAGLLPDDLQIPKTTGANAGERIYTRQQQMEQERIEIEKKHLDLAQKKEERDAIAAEGVDHSKLTQNGAKAYDELAAVGGTIPRSKRGQIDYEELNRMGDNEEGGAGSGSIISGRQDYKTNQALLTDFAKGKSGQAVKSFNVSIDHLDTLSKLSDALKNGDIPAFNKLANTVATQTGKPAPGNFDAAKQIVGDEVVKAIVGSGGGVADREKAQSAIDAAKSPEQLEGVINTYKKLMAGQLKGLEEQYDQTGRKDFRTKYLSKESKELLDEISPEEKKKDKENKKESKTGLTQDQAKDPRFLKIQSDYRSGKITPEQAKKALQDLINGH